MCKPLKARSNPIKIATDWLQTGSRLASDSKISVNGTMLYQCNPTAFHQSEANLKAVGCTFNFENIGEEPVHPPLPPTTRIPNFEP